MAKWTCVRIRTSTLDIALSNDLQNDVDLIGSISAVPSILDVLCRMTGMGFAVVARVTEDRWVACATKDEIALGLLPGGELKVESTICYDVQHSTGPVIIENVAEDPVYRDHHTPALYGFQSYVSFPIVLPDGRFFGTICAIDPQPRILRTPAIVGAFRLFAEMIAHQLDSARRHAETRRLLDERLANEKRQRMLQRELSHRMKNTLAMVQAIVTQSLRNATTLDDAAVRTTERIQALGRAQDMLTNTGWEAADIGKVVSAAIGPHVDAGSRFVLDGPSMDLDAQQSMGLSLAIHELSTNAAKYGALSNGVGHVDMKWSLDGDRIRFEWAEIDGPVVHAPPRRGFGTRLNDRVVPSYFSGTASTKFLPAGVRYVLEGVVARHPSA
jgi:two-component sensor histidine kinase